MVTYLEEAKVVIRSTKNFLNKIMRQPGIEPGSIAWKATMLTFTPPTLILSLKMVTYLEKPKGVLRTTKFF
tara:strand:- start:42 stop:254 length:213 start_codon:yes stop_codon:yes gene_type:complete